MTDKPDCQEQTEEMRKGPDPDSPGARIGKHVGWVSRDACIDAAAKKLVDEHHCLNTQLTRWHHDD